MRFLTITTDWIQAIGMIIGFPAAMWGIISLFRKDKERQKEIDSLVSLARSQDKLIEKISEQIQLERIKSRDLIKPFFIARFEDMSPDNIILEFTNKGHRARIKLINQYVGSGFSFTTHKMNQYIEQNERINVKVHGQFEGISSCSAYIHFQDGNGNNYYQIFTLSSSQIYMENPRYFSGDFEEII